MLARVTSDNQLTLPQDVLRQLGEVEYFDVRAEEGRIVLTPVEFHAADQVRRKFEDLGMTEADIAEAIAHARRE
jgi:bifunctional DNA-binding transcriptional regulator/antitoxin component of YhaV-PrlF toxin-antitoxin module